MPFFSGKLVVRRELLPKSFIGGALDYGGTMTKVALVRKDAKNDGDEVTLEFYAFPNDAFHEALAFLKENADLKVSDDIYLPATGIGTTRYQQDVRDRLGLKGMTQFNEFSSQVHGLAFLANHYDHSEFSCTFDEAYIAARKLAALSLHPEDSVLSQVHALQRTLLHTTALTTKQMKQAMAAGKPETPSQCKTFPALLCVGGSAIPIALMDEETLISIFMGGCPVGGKTFLGFSNLIVGTKSYQESICLANAAKPVATPKREGELPKDKYEQLNASCIEDYAFNPSVVAGGREALARGLVEWFTSIVADGLATALAQTALTRVYLTGGFFMSETVRNDIAWKVQSQLPNYPANLHFLKDTSVGALGSIVCTDALQKDIDDTMSRLAATE